ncbi:MAG: CHAT domain-containing protein [Pyrinomonadaceae bacterium]|nr:CHAT domain-containing protein [Pyrinomonadaceae bacterium]
MEIAELAKRLVTCDDAERAALLARHAASLNVCLARELKAICLGAWDSDPECATGAANVLTKLASIIREPEVSALAAWAEGIASLVNGQMKQALTHLDDAEAQFTRLNQPHTAAATQVSKLYALAMLGRYDEALQCGLHAREVLIAHGDALAAGRIEHNLGNIYQRRDRYTKAEEFLRAARERFVEVNDEKKLAQIDNSLANALSFQHKFRAAEQLYQQALPRAEAAGLHVTQAEIESNLGYLALFQGRYDRALDYLERSRRRYAALDMPHQSAIAEQEMADAYLELNLAPEAAAIYARVIPTFTELGMRAEQARALAYHGRAYLALNKFDEASKLLAQALNLYHLEGNAIGASIVMLVNAQLHYLEGDYPSCMRVAAGAEAPLAEAGSWGRSLLARWLRGEAARALNKSDEAHELLETTLRDAELQATPQITLRCHTSLGLLAEAAGEREQAEQSFKRAVALVEELRATLPAEDFRTAFVGDKLTPYTELVRLCLADPNRARVIEALEYVERARSRALLDMMGGGLQFRSVPRDPFEAELFAKLDDLREELNWFYSQINRPPDGDQGAPQNATTMKTLHDAVREREATTLEIMRQLRLRGDGAFIHVEPLDVARLQQDLGAETALVEYTSLDGELLAFVVTNESIEVVRDLGTEEQVTLALDQLHFQLDALRYGAEAIRAHLEALAARTRHHLGGLYNLLLRPIEKLLGARRLVVVPHRALHYVPFHALCDADGYVIERREVSYAPSAGVLLQCLSRPRRSLQKALLLGFPDARTPHMREEIDSLAALFPKAVTLVDEHATLAALREEAPTADFLHLACHGQFRPDNPLFSSLQLADGGLTVRDAYNLNLNCELVVLSACETGVSAVAPGEELLGLARGFLSAGAPSLMLSLWTVDDETTVNMMSDFYARLLTGDAPAAALRYAQCQMLRVHPHPFFWSPFVLVGRW